MNWRVSLFGLGMLLLLFGVPWATGEGGICGPNDAIGAKQISTVMCAEFWFNRYQTFIGAIAALGAAAVAYRATQQQVAKATEQITIASVQASFELIDDLSERIDALEGLRGAIIELLRVRTTFVSRLRDLRGLIENFDEKSSDEIERHLLFNASLEDDRAAAYQLERINYEAMNARINTIMKGKFVSEYFKELAAFIQGDHYKLLYVGDQYINRFRAWFKNARQGKKLNPKFDEVSYAYDFGAQMEALKGEIARLIRLRDKTVVYSERAVL